MSCRTGMENNGVHGSLTSLEAALYTACVDYLESLTVPTAIVDEAGETAIDYDWLVREIERLTVH